MASETAIDARYPGIEIPPAVNTFTTVPTAVFLPRAFVPFLSDRYSHGFPFS
jgi:hypothetical protein